MEMFRTWVRLPSSPLSKNESARINILVDLFFLLQKNNQNHESELKMRIEIEIPKEFEEHFNQDKFKNSLKRIMVDIFHSLENGDCLCAGRYEYETIEMLEEALENSKLAYDVDEVISQLGDYGNEEIDYYRNTPYESCIRECISKAIEIIKQNNVEQNGAFNDICEWKKFKNNSSLFETSCNNISGMYRGFSFCPYCGKKIEIK